MLPRCRQAAKIPENMQWDGIAKAALYTHFFFHSFYSWHVRAGSYEWTNKRVWQRKWVSERVSVSFFIFHFCVCMFFSSLAMLTSLFTFFSPSPSHTLYMCVMLCVISVSFFLFLTHFWLSSRESSNVSITCLFFTNIILFAAKAFSADSYLLRARNICRITYVVSAK